MRAKERKFFFIHVMKTGGSTLRNHIRANFEPDEVYPHPELDPDRFASNIMLERLLALPPARRERILAFTGHFPFVAVEMLGVELTTITILRDPVERTLSHLKELERSHPDGRGRSLEDLYEDPGFFPFFIHNHQAKLFALTVEDRPGSCMDVLDVDDERLALAKRNLEAVDVLGVQDRFDELLSELEQRFGWRFAPAGRRRVTPAKEVPASFRRRIAEDNRADIEIYEHARRLVGCAPAIGTIG